jgi:C4-dicarboxylate transporter DctM subunit
MGVFAFLQAVKYKFPKNTEKFSLVGFGRAFFKAIPVLFMPLIIVGGIMGGVFTPTEAACVAVIYSLLLGIFMRTLRLSDLPGIVIESSVVTAVVLLIISTAKVFSMVLVMNQIPVRLAAAFMSVSQSKVVILLMINALLLIAGCFMEISAACIILAPILLPVVVSLGVDPVHFGIIMCFNLALGLATPPVGPTSSWPAGSRTRASRTSPGISSPICSPEFWRCFW